MEKIRHIRITTSNKLPERFLTSQVRDIAQDDNKTDKLFFVIEINAPWFSSAQIGQAVINAVSREYSRSVSTSILENFETSLKKANEALSRAAENGETSWIGNINAVIALVSESQIHFTFTGSNFMYLIRDAKINPVSENIENNLAVSPLQTFSNIVSGELKAGDKIIIANGAFFHKIPKEEILESFENDSIFIIAKNIVRKLQANKIKAGSAVMLESITENSPDFNASLNDVVYLDQPITDFLQSGKDFFKKYIKPRWQKTLHFVSRSSKEGYRLFRKHVVPGTKNIFQKTVKITKEQTEKAQKLGSKALQEGLEKSRPFLKKANEQFQESLAKIKKPEPEENIVGKTIYTVNYYQEKKKNNPESFWQKFEGMREITSHWYEKALEFLKKNRRLVYIIAAILFILIFTFSIANRGGRKTQEIQTTKALTALEDAKQKRDEAKMSVLFNDKEKSKTLYQEIIDLAGIASSNEELKDEANQLKKEAKNELDKLIFAIRFENLQSLVDFGETANAFSVAIDDIYAAVQSGQISAYNFATKEINKISTLSPNIQALASKYSGDSIFILTNEPNFLGLSLNDKILRSQGLNEGAWEKAMDFAIFNNVAYLLDSSNGQIWKHTKEEGGIWQKGTSYLDAEKIDIKNSLGVAIDGAIFVLKPDSSVIKLSRGEKQDFDLKNIPTPRNQIAKPLDIFTDENTTSIYILDGSDNSNPARILEFKKDGEFVKQYLLPPDLKNVKSFEISQKDKKAWVSDSGKIYEIEL